MGDSGIGSLIGTWKAFGRRYHGLRAGAGGSSDRSGQGLWLAFAVGEDWVGYKSGNSFLSSSYEEDGMVWEPSPVVCAGVDRFVRGMPSVIGRIEKSFPLWLFIQLYISVQIVQCDGYVGKLVSLIPCDCTPFAVLRHG